MKYSSLLAAAATVAIALPPSVATSAPPSATSLQKFATCAAQNYEGAELLATQPGSTEETDVLAELNNRGCTSPGQDAGILRGAVAEQLFKTDFGSIGAQPKRELIEVFTIDLSELDALDENGKKRIDSVAFGTCVAASDAAGSSALLKTAMGSAEEKAAMTALIPKFAPCVAEGERFSLTRVDLRSALAEGAYRLALAQSLDHEVVVTGTRDPSKSVQCKRVAVTGSRFRQNVCLTEAQWALRAREAEYAAAEVKRQSIEHNERLTTCIRLSLFGDGGAGAPCLMN
jgi:hypothetical protein